MNDQGVERLTLRELQKRGVTNPDEFSALTDDAILEMCRWFDSQNGRVGAGVLVRELRAGGRRQRSHRDLLAEQEEYGRSINDWLRRNFPELCDPSPHPAAIVAVIMLHHRHGKGSLTAKRHGPAIRARVAAWQERYGA